MEVPFIQSPVTEGILQIEGGFSESSAKNLATVLQYGSLPWPLMLVSQTGSPVTGGSPYSSGAGETPMQSASASLAPIVVPTTFTATGQSASGRTLGNTDAPVTLDVWSDYQCPLCQSFAQTVLRQLVTKYVATGKVRVVYHDFLVIDSNVGGHESADAANAARCAADQGKFWSYQDWLWVNQGAEGSGAFSVARLLEIGREAGLDMATFQPCVEGGTHAAEVQSETAAVPASMIGTPSVEVNGVLLNTYDYETVSAAIDAVLAGGSGSSPVAVQPAVSIVPAVVPVPSS
jgi:protein-disulfide isomerase